MKERLEIEFGVKVKESVKRKEMQGEGREWTFDNVILKDFNNVKDVDDEDEWVEHVGKIILHQEEQIRKKNNDTEEKKACTELDIFLKEGKKEIKFTTKELDNKTINLDIKKMDFLYPDPFFLPMKLNYLVKLQEQITPWINHPRPGTMEKETRYDLPSGIIQETGSMECLPAPRDLLTGLSNFSMTRPITIIPRWY